MGRDMAVDTCELGLDAFRQCLGASLEKGFVELQSTAKRKPAAALALTPRAQVPNNHILSLILTYIPLHNYYPKPKYLIIGPFGPLG